MMHRVIVAVVGTVILMSVAFHRELLMANDCPSWALGCYNDKGVIKRMQEELASRGFDPGPADGIAGRRTERAWEEFRREEGLKGGVLLDNRDLVDAMNRLFAADASDLDQLRELVGLPPWECEWRWFNAGVVDQSCGPAWDEQQLEAFEAWYPK